jgi:nitric oxide reductase subunit B
MKTESLKRWAIVSFVVSMLILLGGGYLSIDRVPPYPERVVSNAGELLFDYAGIISGQNVYQRYGLMDHGSVWGHGTLRGPDFSALTIRIILNSSRDYLARNLYNRDYSQLSTDEKSIVDNRVKTEFKSNRYDTSGKILVLTDAQKYALTKVREYYETLFSEGDAHKGNNGSGGLYEGQSY